jgi:competence protein ComGC
MIRNEKYVLYRKKIKANANSLLIIIIVFSLILIVSISVMVAADNFFDTTAVAAFTKLIKLALTLQIQ